MDSLVTVLAVAAWLLLMIPAALVVFVAGQSVDREEPATTALVVVSRRDEPDTDERAAA